MDLPGSCDAIDGEDVTNKIPDLEESTRNAAKSPDVSDR
jgi:hypothetical protein